MVNELSIRFTYKLLYSEEKIVFSNIFIFFSRVIDLTESKNDHCPLNWFRRKATSFYVTKRFKGVAMSQKHLCNT